MKGKLTKLINQYDALYQERKAEVLDDLNYNRSNYRETLNDAERFYAIREMLKDLEKRNLMKTKVFAAIIILSTSLFAWDKTQSQNQHQTQTVNSNNAVSNSHNNTASGGNASGQSVNENIPRMTPPAVAPNITPTDPCQKGASAGGSSPFFGLALGWSHDSKECQKVVAAAYFFDIGNPVAAARILCTLKAARAADLTLDDCLAFAKPEPAPIPPAPEPPMVVVPPPSVTINPVIEMPLPVDKPAVCQKHVHKHLTKPCTLEK